MNVARYAGSLRSKIANDMLGRENINPVVNFAMGAVPEAGIRMLVFGENPIQAAINASVSEYAQGVGQNLSPTIAGNIYRNAPDRGEVEAGRMSQVIGAGIGMLGSTASEEVVDQFFREPVNRQQEQPAYVAVPGGAVPVGAVTYQVNEEDLKRERERQMRNAAFNQFYADQLAEYPIA